MDKPSRKRPAELAPAPWPEQPSADPVGEVARQFVVQLRHAIGTRSIRSVAAEARLDHATVVRVLAGQVWPDLSTIARLELALDTALWRSGFSSAAPDAQHPHGSRTSD
ncbi:hypothetical protein QP735_07655 [Curtobacterium citreum]|uniref:hypothetical protein n=1 Tax=Curtobacterium citreum TaxID=2036 RepID=UPI00254E4682|nr:hypothetical protein [Curtobacterium citreum]MDK8172406.1 hypothetical protein [Curtobacterium citreum]